MKQADFKQLLIDYPKLSLKLLEINAKKMTKVEQQSQFLTMEKIEERLAIYLLDLSVAENSDEVTIPMKMKELAAFLGTTPETLSRKMKLLEKRQLILRKVYQIKLLNKDGLEDL